MLIISKESAILKIRTPPANAIKDCWRVPGTLLLRNKNSYQLTQSRIVNTSREPYFIHNKKSRAFVYKSLAFSYYFLGNFSILTFSGTQKGKVRFYF
jgi:hypothetical protein